MRVLVDGDAVGVVTSGNFSPVLGHGIALGFVPPALEVASTVTIDVRGTALPGTVVATPFVAAADAAAQTASGALAAGFLRAGAFFAAAFRGGAFFAGAFFAGAFLAGAFSRRRRRVGVAAAAGERP